MAIRLTLPTPSRSRPFSIEEVHSAALILASEWNIADVPLRVLVVGMILDLRPADLTPRRRDIAKMLRVSAESVCGDEVLWEMLCEDRRMDFVRRAVRIILSMRGAA